MTRAKSMRGIQSFNQSVNRGRVAQYPEARSRTFSWILGHGYWDTHLTRVLCVSQYSPCVSQYSPSINQSIADALRNIQRRGVGLSHGYWDMDTGTHTSPEFYACPNTHLSQYSPCPILTCCRHGARLRIRVLNSHQRHGRVAVCVDLYRGAAIPESDRHRPAPAQGLVLLLGGLANQFDDFARGPCARYSGVLVRFQVPGGKKDQDRARDENEQAEQHGDSQ